MCEMNVVAKDSVKWKQDKTAKPLAVYVLPKSSFWWCMDISFIIVEP